MGLARSTHYDVPKVQPVEQARLVEQIKAHLRVHRIGDFGTVEGQHGEAAALVFDAEGFVGAAHVRFLGIKLFASLAGAPSVRNPDPNARAHGRARCRTCR